MILRQIPVQSASDDGEGDGSGEESVDKSNIITGGRRRTVTSYAGLLGSGDDDDSD